MKLHRVIGAAIVLALAAGPVLAQSASSTSTSSSATQSSAGANNAGNTQAINYNTPSKQVIYDTPSVGAPALGMSLVGCFGSTSLGAGWAGFGMSGGTTRVDKACERRNNAEVLAKTLGDADAARALMCQDKDVRAAYAKTSKPCV